uniref:DNA primase n=1 Tax=Anatid alphaherpesvirus 2 TaxID=3080522 RepID=A0AAU0K7G4_9ALPH
MADRGNPRSVAQGRLSFDAWGDADSAEPSVKILFAVDGCAVSFSLALLTDHTMGGSIYVISYWDAYGLVRRLPPAGPESCETYGPSPRPDLDAPQFIDGPDSQAPSLIERRKEGCLVEFCLLNQMPSGMGGAEAKVRTRPVFVCRFVDEADISALEAALSSGEPLAAEAVRRTLDETATFALHDDFNLALCAALGTVTPRKGRTAAAAEYAPETASLKTLVASFPRGRRGLATLYLQHEQRVVAAYRRKYGGSTTTAFWYVSKFGPNERTLVLATRYYLLQAQDDPTGVGMGYDLQAVKDLCMTYDVGVHANPTGMAVSDLTSFQRLSSFCCNSGYAYGPVSSGLPLYVERRILADAAEVQALRGFIERDRHGLKIPDREFIKYVYLAHFECYNREQLRRHLRAVSVNSPDESIDGRSRLGAAAVEEFFTHVRSQLNIHDYIKCNVCPEAVKLPDGLAGAYVAARTYDPGSLDRAGPTAGLWECASQMTKRLDRLDVLLEKRGWPSIGGPDRPARAASPGRHDAPSKRKRPNGGDSASIAGGARIPPLDDDPTGDQAAALSGLIGARPPTQGPMIVKRLLAVASADRSSGSTPSPASVLMDAGGARTPAPVYRSAMSGGRQAFAIVTGDAWGRAVRDPRKAGEHAAAAFEAWNRTSAGRADVDASVTLEVTRRVAGDISDPPFMASGSTDEQKYINRNEIFNANLAVGHIILDLDMHIRSPVPRRTLHAAMRGFRSGAITAVKLLMPEADVDWDAHPCYFYKSECPRRPNRAVRANPPGGSFCADADGSQDAYFDDADPANSAYFQDASSSNGWEEYYFDRPLDDDAEFMSMLDESEFGGSSAASISSTSSFASAPGNAPPPASVRGASADESALDAPCGCENKIGIRVSVPVPAPYVLSGASTLNGIARVVQQAVLLERSFVEAIGPHLKTYDLVDVGVYGHGRSLRLPFFSKIADDGSVGGRLLPFYVIPEGCRDVRAFVEAHHEPRNFHFHSLPPDNERPNVAITGLGGDYVSFFDRKTAINRGRYLVDRPSLSVALADRGVDPNDPASVEEFATDGVLHEIGPYMDVHFPNHASEYKNITALCRVLRSDWILLQLLPLRSQYSRRGFTCARYKHSRVARDTVRTYLSLSVDAHGRLCASVGQQCFAAKCGNNKLRTLFTVDVGRPS